MRAAFAVPLLLAAAMAGAHADPVVIASNGQWTTFEDIGSPRKACGVQAGVSGGTLTLSGATDRPWVLRLSLFKSTWHIPGIAVPIMLSFPDGEALSLDGSGQGSLIRADIPASMVKPLIHRFTLDDSATLVLPKGREAPWQLDLHGTTPAVLAMGPCIDAAQVFLPPPFRAPAAPPVADTAPTSPDAAVSAPPTPVPPVADAAPLQAEEPAVNAPPPQIEPAIQTNNYQQDSTSRNSTDSKAAGAALGISGFVICLALGAIALYFVPFLVGHSRKIENQFLLFLANFFFGWTLLGWFCCLLWAALAQDGVQRAVYRKMLRDQGT